MSHVRKFFRTQVRRFEMRMMILAHGIASAAFWTLAMILWTYAERAGHGWIGFALLCFYLGVITPYLALQAILIADLIGFVMIGKIFAFPELMRNTEEWKARHPEATEPRWWHHVLFFLADTSPFSMFAMWALVVLIRMPQSAHGELRAKRLHQPERLEIEIGRAFYASTVRRLKAA